MYLKSVRARLLPPAALIATLFLSACTQSVDALDGMTTSSTDKRSVAYSTRDRECLARAMFFESLRSSREGLVAVGTVVMNRVESDRFPDSICAVVGQKNQFAPGVMTRAMNSKAMPDVMAAADAVLAGKRHPKVHTAKFFHQAGLSFPYNNMHYVLEAGGNAFYEKRSRRRMAAARARDDGGNVPVLAYDVEPAKADAIGAMLVEQKRPQARK